MGTSPYRRQTNLGNEKSLYSKVEASIEFEKRKYDAINSNDSQTTG